MKTRPNRNYRAIVVDIEGTTTPISFVYDTLFPFAREHLGSWLSEKIGTSRGSEIARALVELAEEDRGEGREIPEFGADDAEAIAHYALSLMEQDRKATPLKALQGEVWKEGYRSGELRGMIWSDVVVGFERWKRAGISLWVYSSGSVAAQKLLFGHSDRGDLLHYFSGHFDTTTGSKKEPASYEKIADEIGMPASEVLFLTDNLAEAEAADEAGMQVTLLRRPGNPELGEHEFPTADSFDEIE